MFIYLQHTGAACGGSVACFLWEQIGLVAWAEKFIYHSEGEEKGERQHQLRKRRGGGGTTTAKNNNNDNNSKTKKLHQQQQQQ